MCGFEKVVGKKKSKVRIFEKDEKSWNLCSQEAKLEPLLTHKSERSNSEISSAIEYVGHKTSDN